MRAHRWRANATAPGAAINVRDYGAYGDTQQVLDGALAGNTLTSGTGASVPADVGKRLFIVHVNGAMQTANHRTITGYTSPTIITLDQSAISGNCTGACIVTWGHDDTAAIQAAFLADFPIHTCPMR